MDVPDADHALRRIHAALDRIEAALARPDSGASPAFAELRQRHGALRIATAGALAQLDALIAQQVDAKPNSAATGAGPA